MAIITVQKEAFYISTDKEMLDIEAIHDFLSTKAYWSLHIPKETVIKSIENALCFGVYYEHKQIGFARIITDYATIAYLGDVYIVEAYRGNGLSKWLLETVMNHPELQGLRRWILLTGDAHGLYRQYGWTDIVDATKWMELHHKNVYVKQNES
ncbi:GNAT family N-acetyltransferase [Flavobacterium sp. J27]|uniref:GNAT family N-acetyltransferase n=1 Tax=Flavobacterium sp. J27 TaxID=2060419 RepID=UPI001032623C|nr:GNAT family N-acetyltransferase [Flavobacterium sp. J27]